MTRTRRVEITFAYETSDSDEHIRHFCRYVRNEFPILGKPVSLKVDGKEMNMGE